MYRRMLIPLDGSKTAENVLPYACSLARKLKIPVEFHPCGRTVRCTKSYLQGAMRGPLSHDYLDGAVVRIIGILYLFSSRPPRWGSHGSGTRYRR
jgi:hypothetical protein